jgi:hypothetical protein
MLSEALYRPLTTRKLFSIAIDYTLEVKKGPYLTETDSEVRNSTYQRKERESRIVSDAPKIDSKPLSNSEMKIYHQIKRKRILSRILSFWERFQKKIRLKLFKQVLNFKPKGKYL